MLETDFTDGIYCLTLARPDKRNAINAALIMAIERAVAATPPTAGAILIGARGPHFCAGLDLSETLDNDARTVFEISQLWQRVFNRLQERGLPIIVVMSGAVIGGGLELAVTGHVRIARLIGSDRMGEMMLTGRRIDSEEGARLGLSHYLVESGEALVKGRELAQRIMENAELANWAIVTALPRIAEMSAGNGYFVESLTAALTQTGPEVAERIAGFLQGDARRQGK